MQNTEYYEKITACVNYQAYQFQLPRQLSLTAYEQLRCFVEQQGENINPPSIGVLNIHHADFFLQFPTYGFPYFKINFYPQVPATKVQHYLRLFNNQLQYLLTLDS